MSCISVKTIKSPEFINITSISPLVSKCEIKVLYVGQNRNRSFISKEVATEMGQTLPGVPIVGYYSEKAEDFRDHGDQIVIDGDGFQFKCLTKPYGFVAPDAKVWFQEFEDTDDFGNKTLREYLMCTGYLWTEQYEEAKKIINEGRPHSMELDDNTLKGHWSTDSKSGIDFFIINDAIISKLCTLGVDVEPCFEGSSITAPQVSASFTKDSASFTKSLFTMMEELKQLTYSLNNKGGESTLEKEVNNSVAENATTTVEGESAEKFSAEQGKTNEGVQPENQVTIEDQNAFVKNDGEKEKKEEDPKNEDSKNENESKEEKDDNEEDKKAKTKNTLESDFEALNQKYTELQNKFNALEAENKELVAFRKNIEDKQKEDLINSFYVLSDEDKKEVIENKDKYSLEEIKSKLAVICWEKKVSYSMEKEETPNDKTVPLTFNLNTIASNDANLPDWLKAVESRRSQK